MNENLTYVNNIGIPSTLVGPEEFESVEYYFQFDNDEPKCIYSVTGYDMISDKNLYLTIRNNINGNIVFNDGKGKSFKIFARKKE